ncbi:IstB domain-containing protein ATP-binding protein [Mycobacteroides abscessus subsp. abscessus]|nr:IstB domain-containing protein ATP-binding protein [Mycobacteroides abscessus subsp. abscessus]SLI09405.1 IstB domain-containing protein ATP-binding protein [Mycobacteroides abscessus subsp. abscessus]
MRYDRTLLGDLTSLRFLDAGQSAIILGPVGVGKTHLATALGHMAIRRRHTVLFARSDKLFTRLRAARLDNTVDTEIRRLTAIDVLIIDDLALRPLGATETSDFYEIIVERHRAKTTIVTSNREPAEWLTMTADTLLAQSAIDRLTATAHTLVIEGPSYRQRTRPASLTQTRPTSILNNAPRWSHPPGNQVVPSPWQATACKVRPREPAAALFDAVIDTAVPIDDGADLKASKPSCTSTTNAERACGNSTVYFGSGEFAQHCYSQVGSLQGSAARASSSTFRRRDRHRGADRRRC